jgi:Amt family ammonium transporter
LPACRFGLAFGESVNGTYGIFGNPTKYGLLHNVGAAPDAALAATIPLSLFMVFQGAFAIITPALLIGSVADRWALLLMISQLVFAASCLLCRTTNVA